MHTGLIIGIVIGVVVLLLVVFIIANYNSLVQLRNKVKDQWAQIDVVLKKRADLIPNLFETVKGYAKHESETLEAVIAARNKVVGAKTPEEEISANKELSGTLSRLLVVAESYPELKANENFKDLQANLKDCEEDISHARQFYNDVVLTYKNKIEMFPSNIVAGIFGFKALPFFEASDAERETPKVQF